MPDFMPDDIEAYVARAQRTDDTLAAIDNPDVQSAAETTAEWAVYTAGMLVHTGRLDGQEALSAVIGMVAGVLAEWYASPADEEDDGETGNG